MNDTTTLIIDNSALAEATSVVDAEYTRIVRDELAQLRRRYVTRATHEAADGAELYSHEVSRYKVMPYDVQARLVAHSRDPRLPATVQDDARSMVVMSNQRIVIALARNFFGRGLTPEALIQAGNEGMLEAVQQFRVDAGANVVTYAKQKIKMRMQRACENGSATKHGARLPVDFYNFVYATVQRAVRGLEAAHHEVTVDGIYQRVAATIALENEEREAADKQVRPVPTIEQVSEGYSWLVGRRPVSLQSHVGTADDGAEFGALLESHRSTEAEALNGFAGDAITVAFEQLDERERAFFGSLIGYSHYPHLPSAVKVAEHYGVSAVEAKKVVNGAREKVQAALIATGYGR